MGFFSSDKPKLSQSPIHKSDGGSSPVQKLDVPHKPTSTPPSKPMETHSQVSRHDVEYELYHNQALRSEMRNKFNIPVQSDPYGKKLNEFIKHHLDTIPNQHGTGFYEPNEVFGATTHTREVYGEKHLKEELSKDGWEKEELKQRDRMHAGTEWFHGYFKKKFGGK